MKIQSFNLKESFIEIIADDGQLVVRIEVYQDKIKLSSDSKLTARDKKALNLLEIKIDRREV